MTKETYWQILKGELPATDAMEALNLDKDHIAKVKKAVKKGSIEDNPEYFKLAIEIKEAAYKELLQLKEVNPILVWNTRTVRYSDKTNQTGDIGLMGTKKFRFNRGHWDRSI